MDNSGAAEVGCIRLLKESGKRGAKVGDIFVGSVKKNILKKKKKPILRGQVCKALLILSKVKSKRFGPMYVSSSSNAAILVNESGPVANRIFGPVFKNMQGKHTAKILSLADSFF